MGTESDPFINRKLYWFQTRGPVYESEDKIDSTPDFFMGQNFKIIGYPFATLVVVHDIYIQILL